MSTPKVKCLHLRNSSYLIVVDAIAEYYDQHGWLPSIDQLYDTGILYELRKKEGRVSKHTAAIVYGLLMGQNMFSEPGRISGRPHLTEKGHKWIAKAVRGLKKKEAQKCKK